MNTDDPKLTAYALDEVDDREKSTIARAVANSPEARRFVDETREIARKLKTEFAADLKEQKAAPANLIDIRDDPWFWSVARPLATAAAIAVFAILTALAIGTYKSRHDSAAKEARADHTDVQGEEELETEAPSDFSGPNSIPNPLRADTIRRIERVVIGELEADPHLNDGEIRVIETITDAFRVRRLKDRMATRMLSKKPRQGLIGHAYELMFLDGGGHVIASAAFYGAPGLGFVLQPSKYGYEENGRYFSGGGTTVLPGDWRSEIDYLGYVIFFPDWKECIGYSPEA
jgi:hypothetical protein